MTRQTLRLLIIASTVHVAVSGLQVALIIHLTTRGVRISVASADPKELRELLVNGAKCAPTQTANVAECAVAMHKRESIGIVYTSSDGARRTCSLPLYVEATYRARIAVYLRPDGGADWGANVSLAILDALSPQISGGRMQCL